MPSPRAQTRACVPKKLQAADAAGEWLRTPLLHIQRRRAGGLATGIGGDLVDTRLGLAQQLLAAPLQRLAALVDRDGFLERHLAVLEPLYDRFEFLDRALEGEPADIDLSVFGHIRFRLPDSLLLQNSRVLRA